MHLRYCLINASMNGEKRHPQEVMNGLGITYQHAVPQSISDSWEFWNCENVPEDLPKQLIPVDWNPMERIGWGLSQETAEAIRKEQESLRKQDELLTERLNALGLSK